ncbi:uncharacterized protein LOC110725990 [Chenopodium quinoa]|uniref:uncharacterized protein LOC110725990 n=1 Tax=Chenopodium quinoa TaxID=63459 RepID=UPI000B7769B7|nr:uncharacterized protein LOC110725990 [Chenopodium quinoa]
MGDMVLQKQKVRENVSVNAVFTAAGFAKLVTDYGSYAKKVFSNPLSPKFISASSWSCPPAGLIKFNVDAHIVVGLYISLGVVDRDENGGVLLDAVRRYAGEWEVEMAEAAAVRFGMNIDCRFNYQKIWVESDAASMVSKVDNHSMGSSPTWLIHDDIKRLDNDFDVFVISHVKRVDNSVAHLVARWVTNGSTERVCMNCFPQGLRNLAELDLQ